MPTLILLPGDPLPGDTTQVRRIGPGLHLLPSNPSSSSSSSSAINASPNIIAIRAGQLSFPPTHPKSSFSSAAAAGGIGASPFLESASKRYVPAGGDAVIAQVTARFGEGYRVDLASAVPGTLDHLAFPNANRKNRPNLPVGALVYGRIVAASFIPGTEPEVVCLPLGNSHTDKGVGVGGGGGDAGSGAGYGPLEVGSGPGGGASHLLKDVPLQHCRRLLHPEDATLGIIGERVAYEVVVGMNGRIWVQGETRVVVARVAVLLREVEGMTETQVRQRVNERLVDL